MEVKDQGCGQDPSTQPGSKAVCGRAGTAPALRLFDERHVVAGLHKAPFWCEHFAHHRSQAIRCVFVRSDHFQGAGSRPCNLCVTLNRALDRKCGGGDWGKGKRWCMAKALEHPPPQLGLTALQTQAPQMLQACCSDTAKSCYQHCPT